MNREQIIQMAREAGAELYAETMCVNGKDADEFIERFAAMVAAHEREQCAKVCEEISMQAYTSWKLAYQPQDQGREIGADDCAAAIRARKA